MSFAPPISRDGFFYNGDLYVEVGNLNRHKRASIPEITAILRPDLKKSKAAPQLSKDPVGHWYEAQLIHYGLPPSKDKARAKMRLLEALNTSNLAVPAEIARLEESLRKEFNAAERKAKALHKAQTATQPKETPASKKRKQSDTASINVTINNYGALNGMQFTGTSYSENQLETMPLPAKKARTQPVKTTKVKEAAPKAIFAKPTSPAKKEPSAKKEMMAKNNASLEKKSAPKNQPHIIPPQTAKRSVGNIGPALRKEPTVKEPAVKKEKALKKEPSIKKEHGPQKGLSDVPRPTLGLINGYYEINCPYITREWDCHDLSLVLCLDSPKVWGAYDFGMFSGIILMPSRPYRASETPIPCQWAGRENGEGEMTFGDDCVGNIAFLGDGRIQGTLELLGKCDFTGIRRPSPPSAVRAAASMRAEWEGYNLEAYERERIGRWGRW